MFKTLPWYKKILFVFMFIFIMPLFIILLIFFFITNVIPSPFERRKYKKTAFFKKYKEKYRYKITKSFYFNLLNALVERNCNYNFVKLDYGYFYLTIDEYLILFPNAKEIKYNDESKSLEMIEGNLINFIQVSQYIDNELYYIKPIDKNKKILVAIRKNLFDKLDLSITLNEENLIIYDSYDELANKMVNLK